MGLVETKIGVGTSLNAMQILAVSLILSSALVHPVEQQDSKSQKDIVRSTHTLKAKLVGFEVGDYVHAIFEDSKKRERSMFIGSPGVDFFMAIHANKPLVITYQVVDSYIPEAGGRERIDRVKSAKFGKLDSTTWWKSELKKSTFDKLSDKYWPLIMKLTEKK